jgi:hypothetical protein
MVRDMADMDKEWNDSCLLDVDVYVIPPHLATQQNSNVLVAILKDSTHPSLRFYNLSSNEAQGSMGDVKYEVDNKLMVPIHSSAQQQNNNILVMIPKTPPIQASGFITCPPMRPKESWKVSIQRGMGKGPSLWQESRKRKRDDDRIQLEADRAGGYLKQHEGVTAMT